MTENTALYNAHLEGDAFLWQAGPAGVLLSHGLTATAAEVRPLARRLHEVGYTVAGPLLPGHGTTPADLNRTRWQDWVCAAEETFQRLAACCERIFVGGESMGAVTALYLASEHPETVGVLTYAPAIRLSLSAWDRLRLRLLAPFMPTVPKANWSPCEGWQGYPVSPLRAGVQLLHMQREVIHRLPRIRQPILVVQGRLDTTIHPKSGEIICRGVSSAVA
jgi:carboxylesterase